MMEAADFHTPVLLNEAVDFLINERLGKRTIVDGTLGGGGYTKLICQKLKNDESVISIDKDLNALDHVQKHLKSESKIRFINGNFGDLKQLLDENNIKKISGLVLDLGLSSYQLESEDGFSFMRDTPLDMRALKTGKLKASEILNTYSKIQLKEIFENYGEIGNSGRLVKAVLSARNGKKFETTFDLIGAIKNEYDLNKKNLTDFLARIFQSLRIAVNDELENLQNVLDQSIDLIESCGRLVVISYHSLEDRIVKNFFRNQSQKFRKTSNPFFDEEIKPKLKILTKKPVVPSKDEIKNNPRSRSAKLRAAEII